MNAILPDVSLTELAEDLGTLQWVGMQGIDLPIVLAEGRYRRELHAKAAIQVDLPSPEVKGIHMSRLYCLLDEMALEPLSPKALNQLLLALIGSHQDCHSQNARLRLEMDLLLRRPALVSPDISGFKAYPLCMDASLMDGIFVLNVQVSVGYSSTCPCSAALSRQLLEQAFLQDFVGKQQPELGEIAAWLRCRGSLATPHSQRSEAKVSIQIDEHAEDFGLLALIERIEQALGTPLQTAVKRSDEQAFAALNGQNLMFVEDAARRIQAALRCHYRQPNIQVRHLESLHPHDAVAFSAE